RAVRTVNAHGAQLGIDDPDEAHAGFEIFVDLFLDVGIGIVWRDHLGGHVRMNAAMTLALTHRRDAPSSEKGHVLSPYFFRGISKALVARIARCHKSRLVCVAEARQLVVNVSPDPT